MVLCEHALSICDYISFDPLDVVRFLSVTESTAAVLDDPRLRDRAFATVAAYAFPGVVGDPTQCSGVFDWYKWASNCYAMRCAHRRACLQMMREGTLCVTAVSRGLLQDAAFMKIAVASPRYGLTFLKNALHSLYADRDFILHLVANTPDAIRTYFYRVPVALRDDAQFMLDIIQRDLSFAEFASDRLWSDATFAHNAVTEHVCLAQFIHMSLLGDRTFVLRLILHSPRPAMVFEYISPQLQHDTSLCIICLTRESTIIESVQPPLGRPDSDHIQFVLDAAVIARAPHDALRKVAIKLCIAHPNLWRRLPTDVCWDFWFILAMLWNFCCMLF